MKLSRRQILAAAASYYRSKATDLRLSKNTRNHALTLKNAVEAELEALTPC